MLSLSLFVASLFLIVLIYFAKWLYVFVRNARVINKIPGPPTKPVIGNLMDILLPPDKLWWNFRKIGIEYYPIYKTWAVHVPAINVLNPDDIEALISTSKHITKSLIYKNLIPWLGYGLLLSTGQKWHQRRKILTPTFHFKILQQFMNVFKEQSQVLAERLEEECEKPYTNIVPIIAQCTLRVICETAMGIQLDPNNKAQMEYVRTIDEMGELIVHRTTRPWIYNDFAYYLTPQYKQLKKGLKILHGLSKQVIEERKKNFNYDINLEDEDVGSKKRLAMLDLLISTQHNNPGSVDDEGIREEVDTFMFEGHDTTSMGISFALLLLANHPDVQDKVAAELEEIFGNSKRQVTYQDLHDMTYLEMVIKESLRMYPSVPFISRMTEEEFTTPSGYTVPANTIAHVHIYDMHHNPNVYPDPEKFDPERFLPENIQKRHPFAYLPFSAGPRNCIGQKFAMMELKSAISSILRRFVLEPIDTPSSVVIISSIIIRPKDGIKIKFKRRK